MCVCRLTADRTVSGLAEDMSCEYPPGKCDQPGEQLLCCSFIEGECQPLRHGDDCPEKWLPMCCTPVTGDTSLSFAV